jgi:hypothetical protein
MKCGWGIVGVALGVVESSCTFVLPGINRSLPRVTKNLPVFPVINRDLFSTQEKR